MERDGSLPLSAIHLLDADDDRATKPFDLELSSWHELAF
jgi:hypothetical protein